MKLTHHENLLLWEFLKAYDEDESTAAELMTVSFGVGGLLP